MRQAHRAGEPNVGLQYRYDADVYRCLERDGMLRKLRIGNVTERDRDRGKELLETASHIRGCALHVAGLLVAIPLLLDAEDPFTFYDGTKVTTKAQWECCRKEILAMAAKYLYGPIPGDCDEVSGTVNGGNLSISCTVGGKTESFSPTISGSGEAINLNLSAGILPQGKSLSLGNGNDAKIRNLYGLTELNPNIANAWMVNRVMDVLELNPDSGHDPTKLAVSGCSGCGKET